MEHILPCTGHELKLPDIVNSDGIHVFDSSGNRYVDLTSGVWCTALGHRHPRVDMAMKKQAGAVAHTGFCYSNPVVDRAAAQLLSVTDIQSGKCVFLSSGSEAVEILRQISACLAGRQNSLVLHDAYLGSYASTIDRARGWHIVNWENCPDCPKNNTCDPGCDVVRHIPGDISEFIFEPGSASGFVRFPPPGLVRTLVDIVRKNNGRIIVNEVTTGIGRTGKWFGYQHYGIFPDMIAVGKGLGNGYPVSAAVMGNDIAQGLEEKGFKYAQSHQNDPLGAAVAYAVLQTMRDEQLVEQSAERGSRFMSMLKALVDGKTVTGVRGRGMMFAVDLATPEIGDAIYEALLQKGYIVCNRSGLLRMDPPLVTDDETLQGVVEAFKAAIASVKEK